MPSALLVDTSSFNAIFRNRCITKIQLNLINKRKFLIENSIKTDLKGNCNNNKKTLSHAEAEVTNAFKVGGGLGRAVSILLIVISTS